MGCDRRCTFMLWNIYIGFCRFFGLITALGLWGIGVEAAYYGHYLGFYMIVVAILMTFLESVFAINMCVLVCMGNDDSTSLCQRLWDAVLWVDNWKKAILYFCFSIPCFIQPHTVWMGIISGVMLIFSSIFYGLKSCYNEEQSLEKVSHNATYDRFDDIQDDIEDSILNPTEGGPGVLSLADQQEILEV